MWSWQQFKKRLTFNKRFFHKNRILGEWKAFTDWAQTWNVIVSDWLYQKKLNIKYKNKNFFVLKNYIIQIELILIFLSFCSSHAHHIPIIWSKFLFLIFISMTFTLKEKRAIHTLSYLINPSKSQTNTKYIFLFIISKKKNIKTL